MNHRLASENRCRSHRVVAAAMAFAACLAPLPVSAQATAPSTAVAPEAAAPATPLVNQRQPLPEVLTGGLPKTFERLGELAAAGYRTFVDLRTDAEVTPEAVAAIEAAGLSYQRLSVAGEKDLDLAAARALDALLTDAANYPLVIACSSGNRVGALLAVHAFWLEGATPEAALELGGAAGLTRLEPSVRLLLGLPPAPAPPPAAPPPLPPPAAPPPPSPPRG